MLYVPQMEQVEPRWRRAHGSSDLGAAVAELRRAHGMSQTDLAEWIGASRGALVRLEAGSSSQLVRLMDALSVLGADLVVVPRTATVRVDDAVAGDSADYQ